MQCELLTSPKNVVRLSDRVLCDVGGDDHDDEDSCHDDGDDRCYENRVESAKRRMSTMDWCRMVNLE